MYTKNTNSCQDEFSASYS